MNVTQKSVTDKPNSGGKASRMGERGDPRLVIDDITLVRGDRALQRGLSHQMSAGEITLLTGPNGCGKSSLLRAIAGRLDIFSGSITCHQPLCYVGHADGLSPVLAGRGDLADWAVINGYDASPAAIDAALTQFDAASYADLPAAMLSRGQRRRLALCRLLLGPSDALWLLDEPNIGLDSAAIRALDDAITAHLLAGGMVLAATHLPLGPTSDKNGSNKKGKHAQFTASTLALTDMAGQ